MLIKNYKRIEYFSFNLTETKFILNKNYFERQDLIESLKTLFSNKKIGDSIIKWTEFDTVYNLKTTSLVIVPNIIDFQKDFLTGSKSLFKNLIIKMVEILETKNDNLIELQNLIFNFKLENEFHLFKELLENLEKNLNLTLETNFSGNIGQIISDYYSLQIFDQGSKITENNISLINLKRIYFAFLDCFQKCSDSKLVMIFDDPFQGLNYDEVSEMFGTLELFKNKIVICSWLPKIKDKDLVNLCLWNGNWFKDFSDIFNDFAPYQKYVDSPIEKTMRDTLKKMYESFNIYDTSQNVVTEFKTKEVEIIWKVLLNQF